MQNAFQLLKPRVALLLGLFLVVVALLPIIRSGLYSDDLSNFYSGHVYAQNPLSKVFERAAHNVAQWKIEGRFTPFSLYLQEIVFAKIPSVTAYKVFIIGCNLLAVIAFIFMLWCLGQSRFSAVFLLFYVSEIQFRIQLHDAFTSLHGMYPLLCVFSFACIGFYGLYLLRHNRYYYIISLLLSAIPVLISESGVFVLPVIFACGLFITSNYKKAITPIIPFCFIYSVYILYLVFLRQKTVIHYSGTIANFIPANMLSVIKIQLFSAVPFSNLYQQASIFELLVHQISSGFILLSVIILVVCGGFMSFIIFKHNPIKGNYNTGLLITISLLLLLLPAVILAPSVKYQNELWLGAGYLPVYIQNFGFALLLTVLTGILLMHKKWWTRVLLAILLSVNLLCITSTYLFNNALIKVKNYDYSIPAGYAYQSIKNGIFDSCAAGSHIYLSGIWSMGYKVFIDRSTNKKLEVYEPYEWTTHSPLAHKGHCYMFECLKGDTIFARIYLKDCVTGAETRLIRCDTGLQPTRITPDEERIMQRKY